MTHTSHGAGPGYILVEMTIHDPQRFKEYTALSAPSVRAAGGRYIVAGSVPELLEGEHRPQRMVVVEFPTAAQAKAFYHSAAYQAARQKRRGAADFRMLLLEGVAHLDGPGTAAGSTLPRT
ncbi:MAG TPA: DUF1330 domain-containing protein [Hyphomicrobiaceae bacterium]|jgi:uncharacterized protein (DUF1330 family)|nr:DUF1330 domain-containing protein [Hyphomicrobiaceae bacterium]